MFKRNGNKTQYEMSVKWEKRNIFFSGNMRIKIYIEWYKTEHNVQLLQL